MSFLQPSLCPANHHDARAWTISRGQACALCSHRGQGLGAAWTEPDKLGSAQCFTFPPTEQSSPSGQISGPVPGSPVGETDAGFSSGLQNRHVLLSNLQSCSSMTPLSWLGDCHNIAIHGPLMLQRLAVGLLNAVTLGSLGSKLLCLFGRLYICILFNPLTLAICEQISR